MGCDAEHQGYQRGWGAEFHREANKADADSKGDFPRFDKCECGVRLSAPADFLRSSGVEDRLESLPCMGLGLYWPPASARKYGYETTGRPAEALTQLAERQYFSLRDAPLADLTFDLDDDDALFQTGECVRCRNCVIRPMIGAP
jgi:hypothetical protein